MTEQGCLRNVWIRGKKPLCRISLHYGRKEGMAYKQEVWDKVPYKKYPKQKRDAESPCEGLDTRCVR